LDCEPLPVSFEKLDRSVYNAFVKRLLREVCGEPRAAKQGSWRRKSDGVLVRWYKCRDGTIVRVYLNDVHHASEDGRIIDFLLVRGVVVCRRQQR